MNHKFLVAMVLAAVTALSGCATNNNRGDANQQAGVVIGAIAGGLLGSTMGKGSGKAAAIMAGTLAGAIIGGRIGQSMDATDRMKTSSVLETIPDNRSSTWQNPNSGYEYTVTPTKTVEYEEGPCREYVVQARIGGKLEDVYGTACRQPDGSWKVES